MIILKVLGFLIALFILYVIFLLLCAVFVNPNKEYDNPSRFYRCVLNGATKLVIRVMRIRIHTDGVDKIPIDTKKMLFVGNHRSNFDPIITWHVLKKWHPAFVSKESNFKIPIFGRIIRRCCFMSIDRENPRNAMRTINKAAELLKNGEVSVGIYPEGTRSKGGKILPFHNGVFRIAQKANAPIVVLSIVGTEKIHKNYPFHHSDVYLNVIDILPPDKVEKAKTGELGEYVSALLKQQIKAPIE